MSIRRWNSVSCMRIPDAYHMMYYLDKILKALFKRNGRRNLL